MNAKHQEMFIRSINEALRWARFAREVATELTRIDDITGNFESHACVEHLKSAERYFYQMLDSVASVAIDSEPRNVAIELRTNFAVCTECQKRFDFTPVFGTATCRYCKSEYRIEGDQSLTLTESHYRPTL